MKLVFYFFCFTLLIFSCTPNDGEETSPANAQTSTDLGCTDPEASNYNSQASQDDCNCDYTGFTAIGAPPTTAVKNILLEDFTGEWCGWCVDAAVITDQIVAEHPGRVFVNAIHQGDFLQNTASTSLLRDFQVSSFPSGLVDRSSDSPLTRSLWRGQVSLRFANDALADIALETHISGSNMVEGVVHLDFKQNPGAGNYMLYVYVTESDIPAERQQNYYNLLGGSEDHPYYNKSRFLGPTEYAHHNALREIVGSYAVAEKAIQNEGVFTRKFSFDLTPYNKDNVEILAFVTKNERLDILNVIGVKPGETAGW